MKIFAWNAQRSKDTLMTPFDSIKYHQQMVQTSFMVMDPITGEVKHGLVALVLKLINMIMPI